MEEKLIHECKCFNQSSCKLCGSKQCQREQKTLDHLNIEILKPVVKKQNNQSFECSPEKCWECPNTLC